MIPEFGRSLPSPCHLASGTRLLLWSLVLPRIGQLSAGSSRIYYILLLGSSETSIRRVWHLSRQRHGRRPPKLALFFSSWTVWEPFPTSAYRAWSGPALKTMRNVENWSTWWKSRTVSLPTAVSRPRTAHFGHILRWRGCAITRRRPTAVRSAQQLSPWQTNPPTDPFQ